MNGPVAISRTFAGGEDRIPALGPQQVAAWTVALPEGSGISLSFHQEEGAVSATWLSPDGTAHAIRRNDMGRGAAIRFTLVAENSGDYTLRLLCLSRTAACAIRVAGDTARSAADEVRKRAAAEELLAKGNAVQRAADKEARAGAFPIYDQVLEQARAVNDLALERAALYWKARLSLETQLYRQGLTVAEEAVRLEPESPKTSSEDPQGVAAAWKVQGYANAYLGNLDAAIECYGHAAEIYASLGDRFNREVLEENMARAHRAMGQNGKAIEELTVALAEARAIDDAHGITASLEELGNLHLARGELQQALDAYREALDALARWPDDTIHAHVLNGTGHVYTLLGEYDEAGEALAQSVALWRKIKDPMGESYALDGQGFLAYTRHDSAEAIARYREALALVQGLHLDRETAIILEEMGEATQEAGDSAAANDAFEQSLALARKLHLTETEADCIRSMGEAAAARGDAVSAKDDYRQAERLYQLLGGTAKQALLAGDQANLARAGGQLEAAETYIQRALALIESSRRSIRNSDYRSAYFSTQRNYYDLDISLLMELERASPGHGYAARALEVSERARARALIDSLREEGIAIQESKSVSGPKSRQGVNLGLSAREREVSDAIEAQTFALEQASETAEGVSDAAREKLNSLQAEESRLAGDLRKQDPAYAALVIGQTVSVNDLQQTLLDPKTVLLEYWLGSERSYLWAVTDRSIVSYPLPPAAQLEAQARRLYANVTARNLNFPEDTLSSRAERIRRADGLAQRQAVVLAAAILSPATELIRTHATVSIVAEGALASVPFAALPFGGRHLVETHEIAYLPSASVLPQLRANRPPARPERIALIADPVFSARDPRVELAGREQTEAAAPVSSPKSFDREDLTRSAMDVGLREFPRLTYSRQEAQSIGKLLPSDSQWNAMDFDASREAVDSLDWSQFTIAHFSTHALLDTVHPELSGIVLSLVDAEGRPRDGFMRVRDIYNMRIPAELVVLSACRTALGKEVRGEGVEGLARAFAHAGSQRVVASLWDVNDHATAELMTGFYRELLQTGLSPASALAQAQRRMAQGEKWRAPYFWASFVLQGDWQGMQREAGKGGTR